MKTNYVDMKQRYEMAHRQVWANLPAWKRQAILEDIREGIQSRLYDEFAQSVVQEAENMEKNLFFIKPPADLPAATASTEFAKK